MKETSKKANSAVGRWKHKRPFGKRMVNKATRALDKRSLHEYRRSADE